MLKVLFKTHQILDTLMNKNGRPVGVNEFSQILKMPKSTVSHFLSSLESLGFVRKHPENGKYRLGLKLFQLGWRIYDDFSFRDAAIPEMEKLRDTLNEDTLLTVLDDTKIVYLDRLTSTHHIVIHTNVGSNAPAYCVSSGKVLLAYNPSSLEKVISAGLKACTRHTITDPNRLRQECERIRKFGYAITSKGEFREGVTGVAAPIFNAKGSVIAALSISTPESRITPFKRREHIKAVTQAAKTISRQLGAMLDDQPSSSLATSAAL